MRNLFTLLLFISISISSCVKTDELSSDIKGSIRDKIAISEAKTDYEAHIQQISKSGVQHELSWDGALVVKYGEEIMNIEVPLTNFTKDDKSTTVCRLISRRNLKFNAYIYFIVKRTMQKQVLNIDSKKLDDLKANSITRVYSLKGELLNEFSDSKVNDK